MLWTLIAGGSSGIGLQIAEKYALLGHNLIITGKTRQKLTDQCMRLSKTYPNRNIIPLCCNHVTTEGNQRLESYLKYNNIAINQVVSAIGLSNLGEAAKDIIVGPNIFKQYIENNLIANHSLLYSSKSFLSNNAAICLIGSIAGSELIGAPYGYSVAKAGLAALVTHMAQILGPSIRINMVSPGNVFTDGGVWDRKLKTNPESVNQLLSNQVPLQRLATAEEIAEAVMFLNSKTSSFTTGANLIIDGGQLNRYH